MYHAHVELMMIHCRLMRGCRSAPPAAEHWGCAGCWHSVGRMLRGSFGTGKGCSWWTSRPCPRLDGDRGCVSLFFLYWHEPMTLVQKVKADVIQRWLFLALCVAACSLTATASAPSLQNHSMPGSRYCLGKASCLQLILTIIWLFAEGDSVLPHQE